DAKTSFLKRFQNDDQALEAWNQLATIHQGRYEDVLDYGARVELLAERMGLIQSNEPAVQRMVMLSFQRGLNQDLQRTYASAVIRNCPLSLSDAFNIARQIEMSMTPRSISHLPSSSSSRDTASRPRTPRGGEPLKGCSVHTHLKPGDPSFHNDEECFSKRKKSKPTGSVKQDPMTTATVEEQKDPFRYGTGYWNCGEKGHKKADCKQPEMFVAELIEHARWMNDCDSGPMQEKTFELQEQSSEVLSDPRLIIPVCVEGTATRALLDTGATASFMSAEFAANFTINRIDGKIKWAGAQTATRRGTTEELKLVTSDGRTALIRFEVTDMPRSDFGLIIGIQDMVKLGIAVSNVPHLPTERTPAAVPDRSPCPGEGATAHPDREAIMAAIDETLTLNREAKGFCLLPEAVVKLGLSDLRPIFIRQYRIAERFYTAVDAQIAAWLEKGVIEVVPPSCYNLPLTVSQKKNFETGLKIDDPTNIRVNFDGRELNKRMADYPFEIPLITDIFERIGGSKVYSTLDLKDAFCTFPIYEEDRKFMAFTWRHVHYNWKGAPFGLKILSGQFQRVMEKLLGHLTFVAVFIDDITIHSECVSEHIVHLQTVINILTANNFRINERKSAIGYEDIFLLGHHISENGVRAD
ncbi:MAG: reverse transcriptase family protein, partial [Cyanobacteria bacterium]|nr:reverse transcriptase family protein [Cyanobacteriota bacterium]